MPIYEYACESCGKVTEKLVGMSGNNDSIECPECSATAKKIMSASAFHLKGGGWYSQGYSEKQSCSAKDSKPACANCPAAGA